MNQQVSKKNIFGPQTQIICYFVVMDQQTKVAKLIALFEEKSKPILEKLEHTRILSTAAETETVYEKKMYIYHQISVECDNFNNMLNEITPLFQELQLLATEQDMAFINELMIGFNL